MRQHRDSWLAIFHELDAKSFSILAIHFLAFSCLLTHFASADHGVKDKVFSRISRLKSFALTSTEKRWSRMASGKSLDKFEEMLKKSYPGLRVKRSLPDILEEEQEISLLQSGDNYVVRANPKSSILGQQPTELIQSYNEARFESISFFADGQVAGIIDVPRQILSNNVYTLGLGLNLGYSGETFASRENGMVFSQTDRIALVTTTIDNVRHEWRFSLDNDCALQEYSYSFNGQKICEVNCTDFRSTGDLTLPYKLELKTYNGSRQMSEVMASIESYNFDNFDQNLDGYLLEFPQGAVVSDLRLGRRFKLRKTGVLTDADLADYATSTVRQLTIDGSARTRIALVSIVVIIAVACLYISISKRSKFWTEK